MSSIKNTVPSTDAVTNITFAARDWERNLPTLQEAWARFERWLEGERARNEREANAERRRGDADAAFERLTLFVQRGVDAALEQAQDLTRELGEGSSPS